MIDPYASIAIMNFKMDFKLYAVMVLDAFKQLDVTLLVMKDRYESLSSDNIRYLTEHSKVFVLITNSGTTFLLNEQITQPAMIITMETTVDEVAEWLKNQV